jgi:serine/threonine protein kinase
MIDRAGRCWIIDFGLATTLGMGATAKAPSSQVDLGEEPHSATGIPGTLRYTAPERLTNGQSNVRTEVWSLGATLYELLTLHYAFNGKTAGDLRASVLLAKPVPPREHVGNLPRDLAAICTKALQKKPEDRYSSAGALAHDLRRWIRGEPT